MGKWITLGDYYGVHYNDLHHTWGQSSYNNPTRRAYVARVANVPIESVGRVDAWKWWGTWTWYWCDTSKPGSEC